MVMHSQVFFALINIIETQDMRVVDKLHDSNLSFNLKENKMLIKKTWELYTVSKTLCLLIGVIGLPA